MIKRLIVVAFILGIAVSVMAAYDNFWFQVVDEFGDPVTDFTSATVYTAGTSTEATIYATQFGGSLTNPITSNTNGVVSFFGNKSTYDVKVRKTDKPTLTISGLTVYNHLVIAFNQKVDILRNVVREQWLAPAATSTTACTGSSELTKTKYYGNTISMTVATQPVYPRNITFGCSNAAGVSHTKNPANNQYITVIGINAKGNSVTENIQSGTVSGAANPNSGVGNVAFAKINTVTFSTAFLTTWGDSSVYIGTGGKFGLSHDPYSDTVFKVVENAANVAATSVTISGTYDTYTPSGTPNATMNLELWYLTKEAVLQDD